MPGTEHAAVVAADTATHKVETIAAFEGTVAP
jgi:hypothetical protein